MKQIITEPICRDRIRRISGGFGWVDHRLVRDRYMEHCSTTALALYLFLIAVSNADGVSYWSDTAASERLKIGTAELKCARIELEAVGLIAYEKPIWQVLQLPRTPQVWS